MAMRKLRYFIKEGVGSIFTHRFMSFASVFIIVACLIIMGSFSLIALNVDRIIDTL
jgi:cell division transport system permease protein